MAKRTDLVWVARWGCGCVCSVAVADSSDAVRSLLNDAAEYGMAAELLDYDSVKAEETYMSCPHRSGYFARRSENGHLQFVFRTVIKPTPRQLAGFFGWVDEQIGEFFPGSDIRLDLNRAVEAPVDDRFDLVLTMPFKAPEGVSRETEADDNDPGEEVP